MCTAPAQTITSFLAVTTHSTASERSAVWDGALLYDTPGDSERTRTRNASVRDARTNSARSLRQHSRDKGQRGLHNVIFDSSLSPILPWSREKREERREEGEQRKENEQWKEY